MPVKMTDTELKQKMTRVLNEYVKCGVIGVAFDKSGISRKRHQVWLEEYPEYKELFETCRDRFVDGLEVIAIERAKEKSDGLMALMLKSHRREVYGDSSDVRLTQMNSSPIQLVFAEGMLTPEEKAMLGGETDGTDTDVSDND